jgi:Tat protein secretion system quality control protein TatD with DNase activity
MKLNYIDIHSHLNLKPLLENQEEILSKMRTDGIGTITVGTGIETSRVAIRIAENNPDLCWAIIGIHPTDIHETFDVDIFTSLANHPKVVAIGETGLDYFRDQSPETKSKQVDMFKRHIELSLQVSKPLMLHVRASAGSDDAYYDALDILKQYSSVLRTAPLQEEPFPNVVPGSSFRGAPRSGEEYCCSCKFPFLFWIKRLHAGNYKCRIYYFC